MSHSWPGWPRGHLVMSLCTELTPTVDDALKCVTAWSAEPARPSPASRSPPALHRPMTGRTLPQPFVLRCNVYY